VRESTDDERTGLPDYDPQEGPGQGVRSAAGGSGAGHGGSGGDGDGTSLVGQSYGDVHVPQEYGSNGGAGAGYGELVFGDYLTGAIEPAENLITRKGLGGRGGGALEIHTRQLRVDGSLLVTGESADAPNAGGGSGGSILINCTEELHGHGKILADGGDGHHLGGGGASGGRIAVYHGMHDDLHNWNGTIHARGGLSPNEHGAAGTLYLHGTNGTALHRSLRVDNDGRDFPWSQNRA
jgi:hypothetical protein